MNFDGPLISAIQDYAFLLGKGYPDRRTLELVADTHHLDRAGRAVLYRGVFTSPGNGRRRSKILSGQPPANVPIRVDALNQVYTLASYLSGQPVFIATDGLVRDASGFHGEQLSEKILFPAVRILRETSRKMHGLHLEFLLDSKADACTPVAEALGTAFRDENDCTVMVSDRVDALLAEEGSFLVATSDSTVVDRAANGVVDLARLALELEFSAKIPDIAAILPDID